MALVERKRIRGLQFWKARGRNEWCATHYVPKCVGDQDVTFLYSTVVQVDTKEDPRKIKFHYCSIVAQPVFLDMSEFSGLAPSDCYMVSWRKIPDGWKEAFRDALGELLPKSGERERVTKDGGQTTA